MSTLIVTGRRTLGEFSETLAELGMKLRLHQQHSARSEWLNKLVDVGLRLAPPKLSFDRLISLGRSLIEFEQQALRRFVDIFVRDPESLRNELRAKSAQRHRSLSEAQRNGLAVLGSRVDLLSPMRKLRDERAHTQTLAWLLSPTANSLAPELLATFMQRIVNLRDSLGYESRLPWDGPTAELKVRAEHWLSAADRVDVTIEDSRMLVLIEAKVDALEGVDQLQRYQQAATKDAKGRETVVVFMTPTGALEPSQQVPHLTMLSLLRDWLPIASAQDTAVHRFLRFYLASLARLTNLGAVGEFDSWSFATQSAALDFIESEDS